MNQWPFKDTKWLAWKVQKTTGNQIPLDEFCLQCGEGGMELRPGMSPLEIAEHVRRDNDLRTAIKDFVDTKGGKDKQFFEDDVTSDVRFAKRIKIEEDFLEMADTQWHFLGFCIIIR